MGEKNQPEFIATMQPEDAVRYWQEQCAWRDEQLAVERKIVEELADELREALAAVKTLARLLWNKG